MTAVRTAVAALAVAGLTAGAFAGPTWAETRSDTPLLIAATTSGELETGNTILVAHWDKMPGAISYLVQVLNSDDELLRSIVSTTDSQVIDKLENGTTYWITVTAIEKNGEGTIVGAWAGSPQAVANMPTGAPSITATSYSSITAKVAALTAPGGEPITGYQVRAVNTQTGAVHTGATSGPGDLDAVVTGLEPGATYEVSYAGLNTVDGQVARGPYGPAVQSVPTGAPAPANLRVARSGNHLVYLDWDDTPGAVRYLVYTNPASDPSAEKRTTTIRSDAPPSEKVVTGLDNGVDYEFEVAAVTVVDGKDKVGERSDVLVASPTSPAIPSDFRVETEANQSVYFEWNPVSDAQGYYIKTAVSNANGIANPAVPAPVLLPNPSPEVREVVKGLTNGVEYAFSIATRTDNVAGDYSEPILATPRAVPGSPNVVKKTVTKSAITVTLTAPAAQTGVPAADRYRVFFTPSVGEQIVVDTNTTTATASNLLEGMTYSITAWAGNANGYGPYDFTPLVLVATDKPGAPLRASATREGDGSIVVLNWEKPSFSGGAERPKAYIITPDPLDPQDYDPPSQTVTDTSAVFIVDASADYTFGIRAVTDAGNGPMAITGSLAETPQASDAVYNYSNGTVSTYFTPTENPYVEYEARAMQDTAGSDTIVTAANVSCEDGACVATFDSFADNINGEKWSFQVRATDGLYSTSNWSTAAVPEMQDAQESTVVSAQQQGACVDSTLIDGQCVSYKPFTYHTETETSPYTYTDTIGVIAEYETKGGCDAGWNLEDYGPQGKWCKLYGKTGETRNPPPAGWYDSGSGYARQYQALDPAPAGYVSDGTQWVKAVPADQYDTYSVTTSFPWNERGNTGVINYLVNGGMYTGNPVQLGRCPGTVVVATQGLSGASTYSMELCN